MAEIWIRAERDSASDDSLLISRYLVHEASEVQAGAAIAEVEGSKSLFEILSPHAGTLYLFADEDSQVEIGQAIACVCTAGEHRPAEVPQSFPLVDDSADSISHDRFSDAAWALVTASGLDPDTVIPERDFVTEADVRQHMSGASSNNTHAKDPVRIALLGGSFGASLAFEACAGSSHQRIVGVLDDSKNMLEGFGVPLLGKLATDIESLFQSGTFDACIITIGADMTLRKRLLELCQELAIPLATIIHPRASVSQLATIGDGCLILDNSRIGPFAVLEENVLVSGTVNIDHHCHIGRSTTFGPGVFLSGGVVVGDGCNFGTSIGVESHIKIGSDCSVTSGSVIQRDVADNSVVKVASQVVVRPRIR